MVADAVSGVTGAGKKATERTHYCFANENLEAYGVGTHRHTPEIEQILGLEGRLVFTPHLAPLNRGLLSTVTLPLAPALPPLPRSSWSCIATSTRQARSCPSWTPACSRCTASVAGTCRAQVGVAYTPGRA